MPSHPHPEPRAGLGGWGVVSDLGKEAESGRVPPRDSSQRVGEEEL